ncbi:MAG: hypothetical protein M1334_04095 [Patescibacteria group bacterium]|nr:hypothetical protein [Patescibacteria group bacterium]
MTKTKFTVGAAICGMAFVDSLLIDPFLLVAAGILIAYMMARTAENFYPPTFPKNQNDDKLVINDKEKNFGARNGRDFIWKGGRVYSRKKLLVVLNILTTALFWGVGIGLYFNLPIFGWIPYMVGAQSGRDWMINSGIFHFNFENPSVITGFISGFLFAVYPLWLVLGEKLGTILFGAQKGQKGLVGLLRLK